jgi:methylenetetrahydrofolate--tRNA-(uracil-5-)-methyltransferase
MKPVGLRDPRTGKTPWAVVQLRTENLRADSYNLVGFQNHLRFGEQARVLRLIPGLENARFLRYGQIHRNTYICAPALLDQTLRLNPRIDATNPNAVILSDPDTESAAADEGEGESKDPRLSSLRVPTILFAGQLSGVEGYTESIATGLLAGIYAAALTRGEEPTPAPRATALGSLVHYITHADAKDFQPANITFDLLEPLEEELRKKVRDKKERHRLQCERALAAFDAWWAAIPRPATELRA